MKTPPESIASVFTTASEVIVTLQNGVVIHLSSNPEYLHLHFSGIEIPIIAKAFVYSDGIPELQLANYIDLKYKPSREKA